MARTNPKDGTYIGRKTGAMSVYEAGSGALCVAIPLMILNADVAWSGKHTETIATSDGTLRERSIQNLKDIFGFDGSMSLRDWIASLPEVDPENQCEFELADCHSEEYTPEATQANPNPQPKQTFKIGWMNPVGGGVKMPAAMDRESFLAKWGEKFKAIDTGKPVTKKETKAATETKAAGPARAAASGPTRKTTSAASRSSSLDEVWGGLKKLHPKDNDDQLSAKFYAAVDELAPGTNGENLSPQKWGEIADKLGC
jgi:hypothetical protein